MKPFMDLGRSRGEKSRSVVKVSSISERCLFIFLGLSNSSELPTGLLDSCKRVLETVSQTTSSLVSSTVLLPVHGINSESSEYQPGSPKTPKPQYMLAIIII